MLTIISFYIFLSSRYSLLYIYLYIVNIFKYLFILSEIKERYLYYYYHIKVVRFSLDLFPRFSNLSIRWKKLCIENDGTNAVKYKKEKKHAKSFIW